MTEVWRGGDGPGGTAQMYQELKRRMGQVVWIDISERRITMENIDYVFEVKPFRMAKYLVTPCAARGVYKG